MTSNPQEEFELLRRSSSDSTDEITAQVNEHYHPQFIALGPFRLRRGTTPYTLYLTLQNARYIYISRHRRRSPARILAWFLVASGWVVFGLVVFSILFLPSYRHPPERYGVLRRACEEGNKNGRGNVNNEKIFIAASIYDRKGELVGGEWGKSVMKLVELLGEENVWVSLYENDTSDEAEKALDLFNAVLAANKTIKSERFPMAQIPKVKILTGEELPNRIAFLAEVRNRALQPFQSEGIPTFDKILFINDVMFNPIDAVQLLFSTHVTEPGRTDYGAACAVDFINAFKFYDRYATRDLEGYTAGIPFYPWFTNAGNGVSRADVLAQSDAVRVRSCWGGMVAFEAKWFQQELPKEYNELVNDIPTFETSSTSLRFRHEDELFWEASECCLIHADITYLRHGPEMSSNTGIYMNPYVRVAYDSQTLAWLPYVQRVERLFSLIHNILNHLVGMPEKNERREEIPGEMADERVWHYDMHDSNEFILVGGYQQMKRRVGPGRFCGERAEMVLKENPKDGEKRWMKVKAP